MAQLAFSGKERVVSQIQDRQVSLRQLWEKFLEDKCRHIKAKTQDEYLNFTKLLDKLGDRLSFDAFQTKEALRRKAFTSSTKVD